MKGLSILLGLWFSGDMSLVDVIKSLLAGFGIISETVEEDKKGSLCD